MTKTKYYDLQMDDPQDDYDVDVVNANLKKIDEQMKTRENATDALQEPEFTVAAKRENIASKEKMPKILGKIAKFFADLKAVAFTGNYNDLSDKPTSLLANGGNSDTVNSHTVESNVPKNAKFTDTTYSNFVKSGTGAKAGLVPAPSTTAGTTKYLREDGAWKNPPDTKTSIVNNNTTTEPGSALDARQANPNIEGTMAASIAQINSNLNNNRDIIWSGTQKMTLSAVNSWEKSDKFITLQPGKYILGFKAHTNCKDDVYIDTSMDTKEYTFIYYEKNVNMPVSTKMATDGSSTVRSVTNTFVANIIEPVELHFLCWSDHILTLTYELWALRLI